MMKLSNDTQHAIPGFLGWWVWIYNLFS
jgi:hypothetical protein